MYKASKGYTYRQKQPTVPHIRTYLKHPSNAHNEAYLTHASNTPHTHLTHASNTLYADAVQHVELHLVDVWHKDKGCRALGEGDVVYKHLHVESDVWETPRAPYEVCCV